MSNNHHYDQGCDASDRYSVCCLLCRAIELEQVHAAEILLAAHANALKTICKGKDETTPLHKAIDIGNTRFVKHFAELWQEDVKAKRVMATALDTACNNVTPLLRYVRANPHICLLHILFHLQDLTGLGCACMSSRQCRSASIKHTNAVQSGL